MKKTYLLLIALVLTIAAGAQTLNVRVGSVTYLFPASQTNEMTFSDGTTLTIMGKTFTISDIDAMTIDYTSVTDDAIGVNYDGSSATITVAGNIAQYVTPTVSGAHVAIEQSDNLADEITYTLKKDLFYEASVASDVSNTFFPVIVSHRLYSEDADGKRDVSKVWRTVNQILLGYFDRIESSDEASGFVQTAWSYTKFNDSHQVVRTRVNVKQVGVLEKDLTLQVKISSEMAPLVSMENENAYRETSRILKKFEPLIHEFESKLLGQ